MDYIQHFPETSALMQGADHVDVKIAHGRVRLREFIASMLSYYPWWIVCLFYVRAVFVRFLGMKQPARPEDLPRLRPEDVPMTAGQKATFFIVRHAKEESYWIAETPEDRHLRAYFGVFVEPLDGYLNRFHVATIVHYKHWTGPVYFNTIRPFHHLVVSSMARAGVKTS